MRRLLVALALALVTVGWSAGTASGAGHAATAASAAGWLRDALGQDRVLSDAEVERLAATARMRLRPGA